ncbi:unnamed protein product, partial [marine sediment metagenome]
YVKGICEEVNEKPRKEENVNYNTITEEKYKELKRA